MKRRRIRPIGWIALLLLVWIIGVSYLVGQQLSVIPRQKYRNGDFDIANYISTVDYDADGVDDQTDMLAGVRAYIATEPEYESIYYDGGYPDDEHGVCTDVVAFGMLAAGYDLMTLVHEDVVENRDAYDIETVDENIDFRRVRNLKVYFERNAIALTTDVDEVDQWQGGDIVIFEEHIGVVSDQRNEDGVALVIHNGSPAQLGYEQDILQQRDDIVGHYRIS